MPDFLPSADGRVFDWLGIDARGHPYYLHGLNLMWSDDGLEHDLSVYRGVAERLSLDTAYWSAIIRDNNWRYTLVGCVCLLVSGQRGFFDDLCFRFEGASMVVPQIAVTMAVLHPVEARTYFELVLQTPELRDKPARRVSAERALICLGAREPSEVTLDNWSIMDRDDALVANRVVQQHWDFWRARIQS
jgi:hypothetical protein